MHASGADLRLLVSALNDKNAQIFHEEGGLFIRGCTEWQDYVLTVEGPSKYRVFVDDVELFSMHGQTNIWLWKARFFAGEVPVDITNEVGDNLLTVRLDVSPSPLKLGSDHFNEMIDELYEFDPILLLGEESTMTAMGVDGSVYNEQIAYARLKQHVPQFLKLLREIAQRPITQLRQERYLSPLHQTRKIDSLTVRSAIHSAFSLRALNSEQGLQTDDEATLLNVPHIGHDIDSPANRSLLVAARSVQCRIRETQKRLDTRASQQGDEANLEAQRLRTQRRIQHLQKLSMGLRSVLNTQPFVQVSRAEISSAGLNALSAHPVYARAYRVARNALCVGIAGASKADKLWMSPTWQIYERWTFVRLVKSLQKLSGDYTGKIAKPSIARNDFIKFKCCFEGSEITAYLQPRFPAWDQRNRNEFYSISGERFPDLVLTVDRGHARSFLIFDAKYRVSRQGVLEGMHSAHLYRDSLRWGDIAPSMVLLLVPAKGGAEWLETDEFREKQRVGVLPLPFQNELGEDAFFDLIQKFVTTSAQSPTGDS